MLKSKQVMKRVVRMVGISLFFLFLMLFVLFVGMLLSGWFVLNFFYLCCFCVVCCGVFLSGLLVSVLFKEMHAELEVNGVKESAVRSYYRYHELRTNTRMDN